MRWLSVLIVFTLAVCDHFCDDARIDVQRVRESIESCQKISSCVVSLDDVRTLQRFEKHERRMCGESE